MAQYSIQEALAKMLNQSNWKYPYQLVKLKQDWELLMGKTVAKHTKDLQIRDGKLFIYTQVAPLKNELNYNKEVLIERINAHLGEEVIKEIMVV